MHIRIYQYSGSGNSADNTVINRSVRKRPSFDLKSIYINKYFCLFQIKVESEPGNANFYVTGLI